MNKVKTGIEGLDSMLYGGIPEGSQVILAGGPGAGKTLLGFEYLYNNAKAGNTSVFFAMEEEPERVIENAKEAFSDLKDIDSLIASKKLNIDGEDPAVIIRSGDANAYEFGKIVSDIESVISSYKAKTVVIDSLSVVEMLINDLSTYRHSLLSLISNLRRLNVTSLVTSELPNPGALGRSAGPEFFIFDGVIIMYETGKEDRRTLAMEVLKMRGSNHSFAITPYEITPSGFNVIATEANL
ncbi:MAG: ATPase domain-containing protein [Candidatus Micrarchaeaceae archaeon]